MLEQLFALGNGLALGGWALLILLPTWRGLAQALAAIVIPALLGLAYTALVAVWWSRSPGGYGSLDAVRALFGSPPLLLAGWLHYLAFDLLAGAWIARDGRREGLHHFLVVPTLVLTFLFGPMGLVAYLGLRTAWRSGRLTAGGGALRRAWAGLADREPILVAAGVVFLLAMVPTGLAHMLDDRVVGGVNVWLKPLKFEAALGLFALTLAWFIPMASRAFRASRTGRFVVWGFVWPATFEILYIAWRASRGEASHFNNSTPTAAVLYLLMGLGAILLTATAPALAYGVARADAPPARPAYRLAVVLGLVLTFVLGGVEGAAMSGLGAHNVGLPAPGDAGIPIFGWLRSAGDLRVAHFLGIHAQQAIPIAGALAAATLGALARPVVIAFAAIYAAVTLATFVQAMLGLPAA